MNSRKPFIFLLIIALIFCFLTSCDLVGEQGIPGEQGDTGATGAQGIQGEKGDAGATGAQGIQGEKGDTGEQGTQGEKGDQGIAGEDGKSTYQLYCEKYGYTGTEYEWLDELHKTLLEYTPTQIYKMAQDATVTIECYDNNLNHFATGSGFFINPEGLIVTAYHVIEGSYNLKVRTSNSSVYTVLQVVGFDKARDIAIIKISDSNPFIYLEQETKGIVPGEYAYSFGSSLGFLDSSFGMGVVSSDLRKMIIDEVTKEFMYYVQFSAPISPGNSGGPLLNAYGKVIGIVQAQYIAGDSLNIAAYIKELDYIDQTYNKSVPSFFQDTQ